MSVIHLHLLLNHIPVVGVVFVAALLVTALLRKSSEIAKVALGAAVVIGIVSVAVFFTGEPAEELIEGIAGFPEAIVERHEDAAKLATIAAAVAATMALALLAWFRKRPLSRMITGMSLAGSLLLTGLMAWTANLGGQIRHTEIRANATRTQDTPTTEPGVRDAHEDDDSRRKGQ